MPKFIRYPRGYIRPVISGGLGNSKELVIEEAQSDAVFQNLYTLYMSRSVNPDSWEYQARVIQRCSQLYGRFYNWLVLQVTANDCIYDLNFEFLKDTLRFIRTGQRHMSIQTWLELLLEYPEEQHGVASNMRLEDLSLGDSREFDNFIGQWCCKKDGFFDMLCTTYVLFGVSKNPISTPV